MKTLNDNKLLKKRPIYLQKKELAFFQAVHKLSVRFTSEKAFDEEDSSEVACLDNIRSAFVNSMRSYQNHPGCPQPQEGTRVEIFHLIWSKIWAVWAVFLDNYAQNLASKWAVWAVFERFI